jgi:hypothetical protein
VRERRAGSGKLFLPGPSVIGFGHRSQFPPPRPQHFEIHIDHLESVGVSQNQGGCVTGLLLGEKHSSGSRGAGMEISSVARQVLASIPRLLLYV